MKKYTAGYRERENRFYMFDDVIVLEYDYEEIARLKDGKVYGKLDDLETHWDEVLKFAFNHDLNASDIEEE